MECFPFSNWTIGAGVSKKATHTNSLPFDYRDMGDGIRNRNRHITPESNGGKKCSKEMYNKTMNQSDYCVHTESPMEVKNLVKNKKYIITFCPIDCVMTEWRLTHFCPNCWGGNTTLTRSMAATSNINNII